MTPRPLRAWLLEAALVVVAVLLGMLFVVESLGDGASLPVEALAGVLSAAGLLWFRRSRPVALALVLLPAGLLLGMPMGAFPVALFAVALHRGAVPAILLAGLNSVAVAVVYFLAFGSTATYYESVVFLILLHVSLVAVALLIRSHRLLVRSWSDRARHAEEGQRLRIEQARLAERESIAREMHDVLAHRISLLAVHAGALEVRPDAPPTERDAAGVVRRSAHEALQDLRAVIRMLRTPAEAATHPQPTLADLPALAARARSAGIEVALTLPPAATVPPALGRHAYRIVQEALTNAHTHAPGRPVTVTITDHPALALAAPILAAPIPADRVLADPIPADRVLADRVLADRVLADPILADRVLADRVLVVEVDNPLLPLPSHVPAAEAPRGAVELSRFPAVPDVAAADPAADLGTGLAGLAERVRLVGGRFEHGPADNHFVLRAWLPYAVAPPEPPASLPDRTDVS